MKDPMIRTDYMPWKYLIIAYAFSWIVWLPAVLSTYGLFELKIPHTFIIGIGAFGPLVGAFLMTYRKDKREGVINLLKKALYIKSSNIWLLPAFLMLPLMIGASFFIYMIIYGAESMPDMIIISQPWLIIPLFIYSLFALGALQEEFGWRGYALEKMQQRFNALISSIILGMFWALWHLPLFFIEGTMQSSIPFYIFFINVISISIMYTWLYNNSRSSVLIVLIFHGMHNTAYNIFPISLLEAPQKASLC